VMLVYMIRSSSALPWRQVLPWMAAGAVLLALTAAFVFWRFDPARIHRLAVALTSPAQFSADGRQMPDPPGGAIDPMRWLGFLASAVAAVPALVIVWRRRKALPGADVAVVAGAALTVLALTGPWFTMDKSIRFFLIALLPAIVVGAFAALHIAVPWRRRCVLVVVLVAGIGGTAMGLPRGGRAILNDAALSELRSLAPYISRPDRTLIVAPHGAEWWVAWWLHTHIAQASALQPEDWQRYDDVLFLEVTSGFQMNAPGGGGPPGHGPPGPDAEVLHRGASLTLARLRP